jgi:hypothetical protein
LITSAGIFLWCQKRRKLLLELEGTWHPNIIVWSCTEIILKAISDLAELYAIVGRPNVFSYSELRSATENFCSSNLLGEGGYGSVYKVCLCRIVVTSI